ncbi:hypothetical protein Pcinc_035753 [Petrolisthes cinctipes]|uniref:C2H2-type domain-containing protein n=1 Tax=Petrolisthes cinctipes TaxID=88211 RepID=A0AAE1ENA1_PETCI|nr:hypothetical protein Pcinc_035753 [Petrolisthes cinctipes]
MSGEGRNVCLVCNREEVGSAPVSVHSSLVPSRTGTIHGQLCDVVGSRNLDEACRVSQVVCGVCLKLLLNIVLLECRVVVLREKFTGTFHKGAEARKKEVVGRRVGKNVKKCRSDCDGKEVVCWDDEEIQGWGEEEEIQKKCRKIDDVKIVGEGDSTEFIKEGGHLDFTSCPHSSSSSIPQATEIGLKGGTGNSNSLSALNDSQNNISRSLGSNWLMGGEQIQDKIPPLRIHVLNDVPGNCSDVCHHDDLPASQLVVFPSDGQEVNEDVLFRHCFEGGENLDTLQPHGERDGIISGLKWPSITLKSEVEALQVRNRSSPVGCEVRWPSISLKSRVDTLQTENARGTAASSELKCHSMSLNSGTTTSPVKSQGVTKQEEERMLEKTEEMMVMEDCVGEVMEDGDGAMKDDGGVGGGVGGGGGGGGGGCGGGGGGGGGGGVGVGGGGGGGGDMIVKENVVVDVVVMSSERTVENKNTVVLAKTHNSVTENNDERKQQHQQQQQQQQQHRNSKEVLTRVGNKKRSLENSKEERTANNNNKKMARKENREGLIIKVENKDELMMTVNRLPNDDNNSEDGVMMGIVDSDDDGDGIGGEEVMVEKEDSGGDGGGNCSSDLINTSEGIDGDTVVEEGREDGENGGDIGRSNTTTTTTNEGDNGEKKHGGDGNGIPTYTPKAEEEEENNDNNNDDDDEEESICVVPDLDDELMYEDTPVLHLTATDHTYKSRGKEVVGGRRRRRRTGQRKRPTKMDMNEGDDDDEWGEEGSDNDKGELHGGVSGMDCEICGAVFGNMAQLGQHRGQVHPAAYPHACLTCPQARYKEKAKLTQHMRRIHHLVTHICPGCDYTAGSQNSLDQHIIQHHPSSRYYQCHICNKAYRTHRYLHVVHIKRCHMGLPVKYTCDKCNKGFVDKSSLENHKLTHSSVRNYTCEFCGAAFVTPYALKVHVNTHTQEKKYMCADCGTAFLRKCNLSAHRKRFHGCSDMRLVCEVCGLATTTQRDLRRHQLATHSKQKPFSCKICHRSYTAKESLNNHLRTHTGNKPYECQCGKAFYKREVLRKHQRTVHINEQQQQPQEQTPLDPLNPQATVQVGNEDLQAGPMVVITLGECTPTEDGAMTQECDPLAVYSVQEEPPCLDQVLVTTTTNNPPPPLPGHNITKHQQTTSIITDAVTGTLQLDGLGLSNPVLLTTLSTTNTSTPTTLQQHQHHTSPHTHSLTTPTTLQQQQHTSPHTHTLTAPTTLQQHHQHTSPHTHSLTAPTTLQQQQHTSPHTHSLTTPTTLQQHHQHQQHTSPHTHSLTAPTMSRLHHFPTNTTTTLTLPHLDSTATTTTTTTTTTPTLPHPPFPNNTTTSINNNNTLTNSSFNNNNNNNTLTNSSLNNNTTNTLTNSSFNNHNNNNTLTNTSFNNNNNTNTLTNSSFNNNNNNSSFNNTLTRLTNAAPISSPHFVQLPAEIHSTDTSTSTTTSTVSFVASWATPSL